ncbi:thermonuclease family protein [Candidatus Binatia bacterium]|nr:thermonuclease family protein [Candidatus Binatia bacterium]
MGQPVVRGTLAAALGALLAVVAGFLLVGGDARGDSWTTVATVIDGDTIRVGDRWQQTTVRLIGVDTPEVAHGERPGEPFGREATEFTRRALTGRRVRLEVRPEDRIDAYGRLLAYVFLEDGTFFNRELVRQGYARAYTRFRFAYRDEFRRLEAEARAAGRGMWAAAARAGSPIEGRIMGNRRSRVYHLPGQRTYGSVSERNRVYFESEAEAVRQGYRRARD